MRNFVDCRLEMYIRRTKSRKGERAKERKSEKGPIYKEPAFNLKKKTKGSLNIYMGMCGSGGGCWITA